MQQLCATLNNLQLGVGEWSRKNFGNQESKSKAILLPIPGQPTVIVKLPLSSLAPLLGIGEEVGEYASAKDEVEMLDAIGDIGIYLCDFISRENEEADETMTLDLGTLYQRAAARDTRQFYSSDNPNLRKMIAFRTLVEGCGQMQRSCLKRHQGIRGFDNNAIYFESLCNGIIGLICGLEMLLLMHNGGHKNLIDIIGEVFLKIVKPRNWTENPVDAADPGTPPDIAEGSPPGHLPQPKGVA